MLDIEETLNRELHAVAGGLRVPAMPALPQEPSRAHRSWQPMLAAAAAVLIVLGVVAVVAIDRDGQTPDPAPLTPTPTPGTTKTTEPPAQVPRTAPTMPYTVDDQLYVDGEQVPGTWWYLQTGGPTWLAMRADDNTWWWGRGPEPTRIETILESSPVLSPDGTYVAMIDAENGILTGLDASFSGEGLGSVPVDLGDPGLLVAAVTNDGKVIAQGVGTGVLWLPREESDTVDLTDTAPGERILLNTPAGLVVTSGDLSRQYLAEIADDGELTPIRDLPANDSLVVSPGAEWLAWTPLGTLGGEVTEVRTLEVGTVGGGSRATFEAPDGWAFKVRAWAWETDDHLVSTVVSDGGGPTERMARCSVLSSECVLIDARGGSGGR